MRPLIERAARAADGIVSIGEQDCPHKAPGAWAGEVNMVSGGSSLGAAAFESIVRAVPS